jgi:hypothetical protein
VKYDFGEDGGRVAKHMHLDAVKAKLNKKDVRTNTLRYIEVDVEDEWKSNGKGTSGKGGGKG